MKTNWIIILVSLFMFGCDSYKIVEQTNEYVMVSNFDKFLLEKFGIARSNEALKFERGSDDIVVFFDLSDSVLYINKNFEKNGIEEVFYETWNRKSYMIVVCDPRASSLERDAYYALYQTFFRAGQKLLNDRAKAKYGKSIEEIDLISRRGLGLAGVPFILDTGNIRNVEYLRWVDDFPSTEEMWKRGIPLDLIPSSEKIVN